MRNYERAGGASKSPARRDVANLERNLEMREEFPRRDLGGVKFKVIKI